MSEKIPPLPILTGGKQQSARDPGVPRVKFGYVMRDVVFSVAFAIVAYASTFFLMEYVLVYIPWLAALLSVVVLLLLFTAGYVLIATWGRQPARIRMLRLLCDVIGFQLLFQAGRWFLMGSQMFLSTWQETVSFIFQNLVIAIVAGVLSNVIAPHRQTNISDNESTLSSEKD